MTGTLAQLVTLTSFGNDYLVNEKLVDDFYPLNTSFRFCNKVDFREFRKVFFFTKPKEVVVAQNPTAWFKNLKENGCKNLRLYFSNSQDQSFAKDHKLAGLIGGGGLWLIEAIYDGYSNGWSDRWEVTRKDDPANKIWTVNYGMTHKKFPTINRQIEPALVKEKLKQILSEISGFAFNHNLENWGMQFENAKTILESNKPSESHYQKDLVPINNYSTIAKQILFSAASAWVFGGMGSWNDLGFEKPEDNDLYEKLSEQLYAIINQAIISAVNSY